MILKNYLFKELSKSITSVALVLTLIALANKFISVLSKAASGELPNTVIYKVVLLHIPELLTIIIPLAIFLGTILAFGRLYSDREMVAIFAAGTNPKLIINTVLKLAVLLSLIIGAFSLHFNPKINLLKEEIIARNESDLMTSSLIPGQFHQTKNGKIIYYVSDYHNDKMQGVFIAEQPVSQPSVTNPWEVVSAKKGKIIKKNDDREFLELEDGFRYLGTPGNKDYYIVSYNTYGRLLEREPIKLPPLRRTMPSLQLLQATNGGNIAEFQWRLSIPISIIVLALLAIPMSKINPRSGRFTKIFPAMILFIIYFNMLTVAKRMVEADTLPSIIGVYPIHMLFLALGLYYIYRQFNVCGE